MNATNTTDTVAATVLNTYTVLDRAQAAGLPAPKLVSVYETTNTPSLLFDLADLTEWSRWCEVPITTAEAPDGSLCHSFDTIEFDQPIHCNAVTKAAQQ